MEIQGKIRQVMPTQSGVSARTGNSWMSQDYVMDYFWWPNQTMPSQMLFRVFGEERIKNFDLHENDEVKINFHVEAHLYDGRWFNEVQCTQCQKIGASAPQHAPQTQQDGGTGAAPSAASPATGGVPGGGALGLSDAEPTGEGGKADDLPF